MKYYSLENYYRTLVCYKQRRVSNIFFKHYFWINLTVKSVTSIQSYFGKNITNLNPLTKTY